MLPRPHHLRFDNPTDFSSSTFDLNIVCANFPSGLLRGFGSTTGDSSAKCVHQPPGDVPSGVDKLLSLAGLHIGFNIRRFIRCRECFLGALVGPGDASRGNTNQGLDRSRNTPRESIQVPIIVVGNYICKGVPPNVFRKGRVVPDQACRKVRSMLLLEPIEIAVDHLRGNACGPRQLQGLRSIVRVVIERSRRKAWRDGIEASDVWIVVGHFSDFCFV
jgi:hypothetical protein